MRKAFFAVALIGMSAAAQAGGYGPHPKPPKTPPSPPVEVPEPGAMVFLAGGAVAMIARRARGRRIAGA